MASTVNELNRDNLVFTAYNAGVTTINAGELVAAYNNQDAVTSKANLADNDLQVQNMDTLLCYECVGIALETMTTAATPATAYGAISTRGIYILRAGLLSTAGIHIAPRGGPDPAEVVTSDTASWWIGRALTGASAADAYIVAILDVA